MKIRSFTQGSLLALAIAIATAVSTDSLASDKGSAKDGTTPLGLDYIPLRSPGLDTAIREVVLIRDGKAYRIETRAGLKVENQNQLPLARIPFLGQLTPQPIDPIAFDESLRVGDVSVQGDRMLVHLPVTLPPPDSVVVVNQNNAFTLTQPPAAMPSAPPGLGDVIGGAFRDDGKNRVLIMIRPSVLLD